MCDQWFQVVDENGNPIAFNAEAGAYAVTGEGGSSTTDSDGKCVVTLEEGKEYEAFARGYKSVPDAPDYTCLDCKRVFTACAGVITLTLKHGLPERKYVLHLCVLEKEYSVLPESDGWAMISLLFGLEVVTDDSVGKRMEFIPGFHGIGHSEWKQALEIGHHEYELANYFPLTDVLIGDIFTVVGYVSTGGGIFRGYCMNTLGSKENSDPGNRPWVDVYDGNSVIERLYPVGDTYYVWPEVPLKKHGHEEILRVSEKHVPEETYHIGFGISFSLTGFLPPLRPPIPSEQRIGIREM